MYPIIQSIIAKVFHLVRECPVCKRDQIVPMSKKKHDIRCKFCGARIPADGRKDEPERPDDDS